MNTPQCDHITTSHQLRVYDAEIVANPNPTYHTNPNIKLGLNLTLKNLASISIDSGWMFSYSTPQLQSP